MVSDSPSLCPSHLVQATKALSVLCGVEETGPVAKKLFSKLLSAIILRLGVSSTIETDTKAKDIAAPQ